MDAHGRAKYRYVTIQSGDPGQLCAAGLIIKKKGSVLDKDAQIQQ